MKRTFMLLGTLAALGLLLSQCTPPREPFKDPREIHLKNVKRLTTYGHNAEAYLSPDGSLITFQSTRDSFACDQIFLMDTTGKVLRLVSTGKGRTTCSYFLDDHRIMFASTHETLGPDCPQNPIAQELLQKGIYTWPLYNYDIYVRDLRTDSLYKLYGSPGYDAELEGPDPQGRIVFTSTKDGDLDLYILEPPYTGEPKRLTHTPGYDGGSFFSYSGRYIVYRAYHPTDSTELAQYRDLLAKGLIIPFMHLEIFVYDTQTDSTWQVTHTPEGTVNFSPFMFPDEKRLLFVSNMHKPRSRDFAIYMINVDGTGLKRITYAGTFNSFPMLSKDGKKLVFISDRARSKEEPGFDVFLATWVD